MNSAMKQIAKERVQILFRQAQKNYKANPQLAKNCVTTARSIAMAARIRLPQQLNRSACKVCDAYLVPGETSRVRIRPRREPHMVVTCLGCGHQTRIPLKVKNRVERNHDEQDNKQDETSR